jgi:nitroreductase/NAD-dependent dihydropyrimidine dehydrogenase PreA subunit
VNDCPARIIAQKGKAVPNISAEKEPACLQCQHCLAVCPTGALSILGRNPEDSLSMSADSFPTLEQMTHLLRGRRSVRQYQDANVDPALLDQLLKTLSNTPTGINKGSLTFSVIADKSVMADFQQQVMTALTAAAAENRIPERFAYLHAATSWPYEYGVKLLFRTAPHALLVSAPPSTPCPEQDIASALATFDLLAQSAGIGTVWWGMLSMVLETVPELKSFWGLPADHRYYAMLFGIPSVRYARTVQRDDAAVIKTVTGK